MKNLLSRINAFYQQLNSRERRLLLLLGVFITLGGFVLSFSWVLSELTDRTEHNESLRKAIALIKQQQVSYLKNRARQEALEAKLGGPPLQLSGYIETLAKKYKIEPAPEITPQPTKPLGKKYQRQSVAVRFPRIGLQALLELMQELEKTPGHIVQITQISLRPLDDKHKDFNVEQLMVSTYELASPNPSPADKTRAETSSSKETP